MAELKKKLSIYRKLVKISLVLLIILLPIQVWQLARNTSWQTILLVFLTVTGLFLALRLRRLFSQIAIEFDQKEG